MAVRATRNVKKGPRSSGASSLTASVRKLFRKYNDKLFHGRVSEYRVRVRARLSPVGWTLLLGYCDRKNKIIYIRENTARNKKQLSGTLLHEMAHAVTGGGHTTEWRAEIVRLQEAGASIFTADLKVASDGESDAWPAPVSVTRDFIERAAREFFVENPDAAAPSKFLHWLIRDSACGVSSQEALLRRYPWVLRVFHETQRKNREELVRVAAFQQEFLSKKEAEPMPVRVQPTNPHRR